MDLKLQGKIALVGGSSAGIGRAIARELANEGASVIICAREEQRLNETRDHMLKEFNCKVLAVPADLSKSREIDQVVAQGRQELGPIDILVNNTGGPPAGQFEDLSPESWEAAVKLLLYSALNLTRAVLPDMKARGWGRILNVTSVAVKQPVDNLMLSNSLRSAVTGFARTLANEVAPYGITVNNILPGHTKTERLQQLASKVATQLEVDQEEIYKRWKENIPTGRFVEPNEFAALVTFLASERASSITGTSIPVDGGWIRSLL